MSDYPMLISNKLHSFRNFTLTKLRFFPTRCAPAAKNMRLFALSPPEPDSGSERRQADEGRIRNPDSGLHR